MCTYIFTHACIRCSENSVACEHLRESKKILCAGRREMEYLETLCVACSWLHRKGTLIQGPTDAPEFLPPDRPKGQGSQKNDAEDCMCAVL